MNDIRFADNADKKAIQCFIDGHWKAGHILAISDDVFDWLYNKNGTVNFVIAEIDSKITGILGFIESNAFDKDINENTLWLALWKVNESAALPATGIRLLKFLEGNKRYASIGTLGITPIAEKIYQALGYRVGTLDHYYIANSTFNQGVISSGIFPYAQLGDTQGNISELDNLPSTGWTSNQFPCKSLAYLKNKYELNPFYAYKFLMFSVEDRQLILIGKVVTHEGTQALRIVDLFGETSLLKSIATALQEYIERCDYEFVDLLLGSDHLDLTSYGFSKVNDKSAICVPQYYEPFLQKNSSIGFALKYDNAEDFILVKGDADQDRPNQVFWESK